MRKLLVSVVLGGVVATSSLHAAVDGGFIGLDLESAFGTNIVSGSGQSSSNASTMVAFGLKGGYQSIFDEVSGVRFYVSVQNSYGATASGSRSISAVVSYITS